MSGTKEQAEQDALEAESWKQYIAERRQYIAEMKAREEEQIQRNTSFPRRLFVNRYGYVRYRWKITGIACAVIAIMSAVFGFLIGGAMWLDMASCHSRWRAAGIETSWGPLQQCVIKTETGWVPERVFRDVKVRQ